MPTDDERIDFLLENIHLLGKGSERKSLESQISGSRAVTDFLDDPR
jgi:hypothetical protein